MNEISKQLLSAIDVLTDEKISKLEYDKTIQATITKVEDLDSGEYKVRYSGNIFSAYASDVTTQYAVGDVVYVTVPEGNFSNKKVITSTVTALSLSYSLMQTLKQSISEVSPTFDNLYTKMEDGVQVPLYDASGVYEVIAGADPDSDDGHDTVLPDRGEYNIQTLYHDRFLQYANNYELIRIKASFLTRFHDEHTYGNYGIKVTFYAKGDSEVSYSLDVSAFNGDPYRFSVYSPQSVVFKVLKNYLLGLKSITFFQEGFSYDHYVVAGVATEKYNDSIKNIFCKDIEIQFVEEIDLTDTRYYLSIAAPRGNSVSSANATVDLVGQLVYQGESILEAQQEKCKFLWYLRDPAIKVGDDEYDRNAGFGWKPISNTTYMLSLTGDDIVYHNLYKLIVVYNDTNVLSAEASVYNLNKSYSYALSQVTEGEDILLLLINKLDDEQIVADWYYSTPDGSYIEVTNGKKRNAIQIKDLLLYSTMTFYCAVYDYEQSSIIDVLEYVMSNSNSEDDITITYVGDDSFRYDANGDITIEDSEQERTLQINLTWKDGVGTSYTVDWLGPDGKAIARSKLDAISPSESMMDNLWIDNSNILHYTIKLKYKVNYNNNTISVKITTVNELEYTKLKTIQFLKDGDLGTNGTTYVVAIRPCDSDGVKLSGLKPLVYNDGAWLNSLRLRCYAYKDGELLSGIDGYKVTYVWSGNNIKLSSTTAERVIADGQGDITSDSTSADLAFYVKALVTIDDETNDRKTEVYASYPIDVAVGGIDYETVDISDIPSYIKYTSSGTNPSFYSNDIHVYQDGNDYASAIVSLNEKILLKQERDDAVYLKPASSYIAEVSDSDSLIGVLKCLTNDSDQYIIHPVVMYLDTYGNEAISGWDGTKLDINEDGGYILAPQIGAGEKDSSNRFTGVVMGKDSGLNLIGLYGYKSGLNTFGLKDDGTAYFGSSASGGLISFDGNNATITGNGGGNKTNGMTIRVAASSSSLDAIKVNDGVFNVTYGGALTATSATIDGTIYASDGLIGCTKSGSTRSGGWRILPGKIYSGSSTNYIELNSATPSGSSTDNSYYAIFAGSSTATSAKFSVKKDGTLTATAGHIGNWQILKHRLVYDDGKVGIANNGTFRFWAGASSANADGETDMDTYTPLFSGNSYFYVNSSGLLGCKNANISGTVKASAGSIGGWTINNNRLENSDGTVYLGASGFLFGNNFSVSSSGLSVDGTVKASAGSIGNWTISSGSIYKGNTTLGSDGKLTCKDGEIGGWTIGTTTISSGIIKLTSGTSPSITIDNIVLGKKPSIFSTNTIAVMLATSGSMSVEAASGNAALKAKGGSAYIQASGSVYIAAGATSNDGTVNFLCGTVDFGSNTTIKNLNVTAKFA